jgi:aminoglycoside phosphotransferase (APT) family kinase protein
VDLPDDAGLVNVLRHFDIDAEARVGHGGEAGVYALDRARVLRVLHSGGRVDELRRRQALVDELALARPRFALPELLEVGELDGRVYAVERRLSGRSLLDELRDCDGANRAELIEAHLDTVAALGDLHLAPRAGYGDLIDDAPLITATWREYLEVRTRRNLDRSVPELRSIDARLLAEELPEPAGPAFVHLDAWIGNMLTDGSSITAVIDFGLTCVAGDRRLDPVSAVVYLAAPEISGAMPRRDLEVATSWLRAAGLGDWYEPARRWLAAYWSFAIDDPSVLAWCRRVLAPHD